MSMFSQRLYHLRNERHLSQKQLADELEIPVRSYQRYEYAQQEPPLSKLVQFADYFQVSLDYLVGLSENPRRRK